MGILRIIGSSRSDVTRFMAITRTVRTAAYIAPRRIHAIARMMTEAAAIVAHRFRAHSLDVSWLTAIVAFHWWPLNDGDDVLPRKAIVRRPRAVLREMSVDGLATLAPIHTIFSLGN